MVRVLLLVISVWIVGFAIVLMVAGLLCCLLCLLEVFFIITLA